MKVLALVPSLPDTAPGQRFRVEQWARYLEPKGLEFTFSAFEDSELHDAIYQRGQYSRKALLLAKAFHRRLQQARAVRNYDVVYLHREAALIGPALIEKLIARHRVPIVYDFDDPIWMPYRSPANGLWSALKCYKKTATICRFATAVIVGNRLLARYAKRHNNNVFVVPSTIDLARYPPRSSERKSEPVVLGWTGSHSTLPFLEAIRAPLRELAGRHQIQLLVISHSSHYALDGLSVIARKWRSISEAEDLAPVDIALAPFPSTGWTPWRCHGKVLQYMASGMPLVTSPVGIVVDYVRNGENGLWARTPSQWVEQIERLIVSPALRQRLGSAARKTVEQRYSAEDWAQRFGQILAAASAAHSREALAAVQAGSGWPRTLHS